MFSMSPMTALVLNNVVIVVGMFAASRRLVHRGVVVGSEKFGQSAVVGFELLEMVERLLPPRSGCEWFDPGNPPAMVGQVHRCTRFDLVEDSRRVIAEFPCGHVNRASHEVERSTIGILMCT